MSQVMITESYLEDIADAIRAKNGQSSATYTPAQMATAISNISTSGGGGSATPTLQDKTVSITPSETAQSQTVSADSGYDGLDEVTVSVGAISSSYVGSGITSRSSTDLSSSGATVTAPAGYYASDATKSVTSGSATTPATSVTANPTISVNSSTGLITATASATKSVTPTVSAGYVSSGTSGTITVSGSNTEQLSTQSGTTITPTTSEQTAVAAGKYTLGAVKVAAMTTGTAGTPTATKGTVSNNSISVTPSVTNTTGYITGSTKTGTAVSVSASELVSGNKEITSNGTNIDVTNYATASVAVSSSVTIKTTTTTNSSNQNTSISFTSLTGTPKAFFVRCTSSLSRSSSNTYYYVATIRWNGDSSGGVTGNVYARSTGQLSNVTSGYSYSISGTTLTVSSSGARNTSPGSFYNGTYELVYIY